MFKAEFRSPMMFYYTFYIVTLNYKNCVVTELNICKQSTSHKLTVYVSFDLDIELTYSADLLPAEGDLSVTLWCASLTLWAVT